MKLKQLDHVESITLTYLMVACQEIALTEDRLNGRVFVPWSGSLETLPTYVPNLGKHELSSNSICLPEIGTQEPVLEVPTTSKSASTTENENENDSPKIQRFIPNLFPTSWLFLHFCAQVGLSPRNDGACDQGTLRCASCWETWFYWSLAPTTRNNINTGKSTKMRG
jgi:hypothetical protein